VPIDTDAAKAYPKKLRIKSFFWIFGECSEDANLDRHIDLCPGGYHINAPQPGSEPLHNFTGNQHCSF
jgi:hypothetical protein